jgi:NAD kinase
MFNKINIIIKKGLKIEGESLKRIKEITHDKKVSFVSFEELKKEHLHESDLVITIGGDGTFIKAANILDSGYILGINANPDKSEGALTTINLSELDKLIDILNGKFETLLRQRAKVKINGKLISEEATNEVYIGAESQFHSSRYKIKFKDLEEEHRSSGIIISTGTGSPAWYYSAGGEIFNPDEPKLAFIVREPYFGKRVFKPKILKGNIFKGEKLTIFSERDYGGIISINDLTFPFNKGEVVEVELSNNPLKCIK